MTWWALRPSRSNRVHPREMSLESCVSFTGWGAGSQQSDGVGDALKVVCFPIKISSVTLEAELFGDLHEFLLKLLKKSQW